MQVVAAFDKFRGTLTAQGAAEAACRACAGLDVACNAVPLADGGEGTLDVLGGPNRATLVSGPLGDPVEAGWRLRNDVAVIEMARASGLGLAGGAEGNDPLAASTYGTGELIQAAADAGAQRILVGVGGSATTDGGLGAIRALHPPRLRGIEIEVACDVRTLFVDAASEFGPQKGATPSQVKLLTRRLERLAQVYQADFGVDVSNMAGGGAAGGLGGGLGAVGASLAPGFEVVAEAVDLVDWFETADLVLTGEGQVDATSFEGKVVGGVIEWCADLGVPVVVVAGRILETNSDAREWIGLEDRFGTDRAFDDAAGCVTEAVAGLLG